MKPRDGAEACLFCCSSHGIRHIGSHIGSAWAFFHTSGMHCGCRRLKQSYRLLAPDPLEDIIPHYDLRANNAPPTVLPIKNTLPMEIVLRVSVCPSNTRVHVPNDVRHTGISHVRIRSSFNHTRQQRRPSSCRRRERYRRTDANRH